MLKLSNAFLKVGIILSTITIVLFALCALSFFICIPFAGLIVAEAAESGASGSEGTIMQAGIMAAYFVAGGVAMLLCIPLYAVLISLSWKTSCTSTACCSKMKTSSTSTTWVPESRTGSRIC